MSTYPLVQPSNDLPTSVFTEIVETAAPLFELLANSVFFDNYFMTITSVGNRQLLAAEEIKAILHFVRVSDWHNCETASQLDFSLWK